MPFLASSFVYRITNFITGVRRPAFWGIVFAQILLLSACVSPSSLKNAEDDSSALAQHYIDKARKADDKDRSNWLLLASEELIIQQRTDKAMAVLNNIDPDELTNRETNFYHLLMAQALFSAKRYQQSLTQYIQIAQPSLLDTKQQIAYFSGYAELLAILEMHYESALKRIALSEYLTDQLDIEENRELLWTSLIQVENLAIYKNSLNSFLVSGWIELADLAKVYAEQPEILLTKFEQWRNFYNEHPANIQLPIDMARAAAARSYQPSVIALLLPENGKLANSAMQIRNGFLTAIYKVPEAKRPRVLFFDSSGSSDIKALYQKAIDQGAHFVIGPLRKESVADLASLEVFPIPVMAINRLDNELLLPENFYQFGLPVEDEARQAAIKAWEDGLSRAIILVPNGQVGERTSKAFTEQFERMGGETYQTVQYHGEKDYARAVQTLLGVDKSVSRYRKLQQTLGIPLKHNARRRQDPDFLFFKASANQARRIKPFIDFYYAHDLPLYSISSIYNGKVDPQLDRDLDKVLFCDIPWLLSESRENTMDKKQVSAIWPNSTYSHQGRFFALGYDLYTLIPDLNKLRNFPQYQKAGLSGKLSVDQLGHIQRTLSWAKFVNGKAIQIEDPL
ncbi:MAG: hypothetical protein DRQ47_01485 [Gammaproteobacteria bacterium]|nr:MAG: hypothetical protein DRQ47_01485 [Gammaproteobacteria bacterium]